MARPTKFDPSFPDTIIACAKEGGSVVARSVACGITSETYYQWINPNSPVYQPEFHEAHLTATELCQQWWEQQGMKGLWTDPKSQRFDSRVWHLNMMNRFGWGIKNENKNENTEIELTFGSTDTPDTAKPEDA